MKTIVQPSKLSKRGKLVNTQHVDQLVSHYKKERWVQNSRSIGKVDSLSTWYGMDELQSFLDLAKENQADGIKMYYGVYPADYAEPELCGRQTVVLVATKQKETSNGIVNKEIYRSRNGKPEILAFNFGTICPPFCSTGLPPDGDGAFGFDMSSVGISIIEKDGKIIIA